MKKSYQRYSILVILLSFFVLYFLNANSFKKCFLDYTELFFNHLFPASFPFFIISSLLIDYGLVEVISIIFPNSASIYILLLSMFSGFPSGAKYSKDLYTKNKISKDSASHALTYSHFPNPLFLLGSVSSILDSQLLAFKILISFFLSNLILFFIIKKEKEKFSYSIETSSFSKSLTTAITDASRTIILIYGTSLLFYLLSVCITQSFTLPPLLYVLICGMFDLTQGVFSTAILSSSLIRAYFILFFLSFGSLSIHLQVKEILDTDLDYFTFLKGRIWGTLLCFIIFTILII